MENYDRKEMSTIQPQETEKAFQPDNTVRNQIEDMIAIDPITKALMEKYKLTEESEFFRVMQPYFIVGKTDDGKYLIRGNPDSITNVFDPYDNKNKKRASALADPGINVTDFPSEEYLSHGSLTIKVRLGDLIKQDGKIYFDCASSASSAWYLTIPKEKLIPVAIHSGLEYEAELGILYNNQLQNIPGEVDVYEWGFEPENYYKAVFHKKTGEDENTRYKIVCDLFFELTEEKLILKSVQTDSGDKKYEENIRNAIILRILMKHPEIKEVESVFPFPKNLISSIIQNTKSSLKKPHGKSNF